MTNRSCLLALICIIILSAQLTCAEDVRLVWEANDDAVYYRVYWSVDPNNYFDEYSIDTESNSLDLQESTDSQEYYYTIRAYSDCGFSSEFSDEVITPHIPKIKNSGKKIVVGIERTASCFIDSIE